MLLFNMIADHHLVGVKADSDGENVVDGHEGYTWQDMMMLAYLVVLHLFAAYSLLCSVQKVWKRFLRSRQQGDQASQTREQEISALMALTQDKLRDLCRARSLAVTGNKSVLVERLIDYTPSEVGDAPTQKQLDYLVVLERKTGKRAPANAYLSRRAATAAIDKLKNDKER